MSENTSHLKLLIFLHGTSIVHMSAFNLSREQIVQQIIKDTDKSISDFATYIPIGDVVKKLTLWQGQGAEIMYLSSHLTPENVKKDEIVLKKNNFPEGIIYYRKMGKNWNLVIEECKPDIIIEDDCESIGGNLQMTYPNLAPTLQSKIKSIVVKEFAGIDNLPDNIDELKDFSP